jgi:hypothetical protein
MDYLEKAELALAQVRRDGGGPSPVTADAATKATEATNSLRSGSAADLAWLTRVIERDLGLPPGSLVLYDPPRPCPGCCWCSRPAPSSN